jgi:hypothetical protein
MPPELSATNAIDRLVDAVKKLPDQFFQPLPREVISYWLEGSYTGGIAASVAYDQLGWALMMRGFYRYKVNMSEKGKKPWLSHRGYCVIDLYNGEVRCHGIRVHTSDAWEKFMPKCDHPLLWKSEVSAIRAGEPRVRLICALRLLETKKWQGSPGITGAFDACWTETLDKETYDNPKECAIAISYIASHFEQDWHKIKDAVRGLSQKDEEDLPGEVFSGFMVYANADDPVALVGDFITFGVPTVSATTMHGSIEFTRIDRAVL